MKYPQPTCAKVKQIVKRIKKIETPTLDNFQLNRLSEILADVSQVLFASMVVGQFLTGIDKHNVPVIVSGLIMSMGFWVSSISLVKEKV